MLRYTSPDIHMSLYMQSRPPCTGHQIHQSLPSRPNEWEGSELSDARPGEPRTSIADSSRVESDGNDRLGFNRDQGLAPVSSIPKLAPESLSP